MLLINTLSRWVKMFQIITEIYDTVLWKCVICRKWVIQIMSTIFVEELFCSRHCETMVRKSATKSLCAAGQYIMMNYYFLLISV